VGTVGLAFGSPTSGTGFNVSSTVAEIIGNLQNVETPWKTQLTSLESQDTVISSLGTLFSNLSNDMSSLSDPEGILAQKEGSSSDTNVLELTSATSSAAAGTHTVAVKNLAQTSSGYLAEIASSANTLSGSITLNMGKGTAQTFTMGAATGSGASNTVYTGSGADTLGDLASAINSSSLGITASVLTDASGSRLSLVSGTSGAGGNIVVSDNTILDASASNTLGATLTAGSGTGSSGTASTALFTAVASSSEQLSSTGTLNVTVGSGSQQSISMSAVNTAEGGTTLTDLENYINSPSNAFGFSASIVDNSDGTVSLQLTSGTLGTTGTLAVSSTLADANTALAYTATVAGSDANLTVDGVNLTNSSNTVSNLIPGLTFQLLAPSTQESDGSLEQVQVVINNDNSGVESTVNQFVSDYNSLISAVNAQEGNTSSGTPEPLFGSPTLSLLQQELLNGLNAQNPNGVLTALTNDLNPTLSGSITIQVGNGTAQPITLTSSQTSLSDLAQAINSAAIGVTAAVVTSDGQSTLTLASETSGSAGTLTVSSSIVAASDTPLSYSGAAGTSSVPSQGTLTSIPSASDILSGSISVQVGTGTAQTVEMSAVQSAEGGVTLGDLQQYITTNSATLGFSASLVTNSDGSESLSLVSNTSGSSGSLTVGSNLIDTTHLTNATLSYTNASDINSLTALGVSVNNDGSITFDASALDSVLNSDYASVTSFFQNATSWGQNFSNLLNNSGSSSSAGILGLAATANSTTESTLNAEITKEQSYISAQQSSLTTELNQANQLLEELPSQLQGINELYSAVTGYNQNSGG
jgi:flagellar hook-associated protein 2